MKRFLMGVLLLSMPAVPSLGGELSYGVLPESDQLFHRILADPRQAQTTSRYFRSAGENVGDVSLGNVWGMARWYGSGGFDSWVFQLDLEGMAYSRFLLSGGINEFQTIDFFANVPLLIRRGAFSGQLMLFHQSSHLGDDYIRRTNDKGFRFSIEGVRALVSYEPAALLRIYGGSMRLLHSIPRRQKGNIQYGFEVRTRDLRWRPGHQCWFYLAQDFKNQGRTSWNLNSSTQIGFRMGIPRVARAVRVHGGYFEGYSEFGQFYAKRESHFDFGITFDF